MSNRLLHFLAPTGLGLVCLAIGLSLFQLWQPVVGFFPPGVIPFEKVLGLLPATYFRPAHLAWILVLGLFYYPLGERTAHRLLDLFLAAAVIWSVLRVLQFDYQSLDHLLNGLSTLDFFAGMVIIFVTLEVARRSVGDVKPRLFRPG